MTKRTVYLSRRNAALFSSMGTEDPHDPRLSDHLQREFAMACVQETSDAIYLTRSTSQTFRDEETDHDIR